MPRPTCPRCAHRKFAMMKGGKLRCLKCSIVIEGNREGVFAPHTNPERAAEINEREHTRN